MRKLGWIAGFLCAAGAFAAAPMVGQPGAINYVEGQAAVDGKAISPGTLEGVAAGQGQTLSTDNGKVEALLVPGVFLRLAEQTAVKMTSLASTDTQIELLHGEALIEVIRAVTGRVLVLDGQARVTLQHPGVYELHASQATVAVIVGKARVQVNDHVAEVGAGREYVVRGDSGGSESKLSSPRRDALCQWSAQRAVADARASVETAQGLVGTDPSQWKGPGWYWNPFYGEWGFLPASYTISGPFGETYFSARFYWEYASAPDTHSHGYFTAAQ